MALKHCKQTKKNLQEMQGEVARYGGGKMGTELCYVHRNRPLKGKKKCAGVGGKKKPKGESGRVDRRRAM